MAKSLWAISFKSSNDYGSGVITLDGDQVYGGDHGYYYLGICTVSGNSINATVTVKKHNPAITSIFGNLSSFSLSLSGSGDINAGHLTLTGNIVEYPQAKMTATMRKLETL